MKQILKDAICTILISVFRIITDFLDVLCSVLLVFNRILRLGQAGLEASRKTTYTKDRYILANKKISSKSRSNYEYWINKMYPIKEGEEESE